MCVQRLGCLSNCEWCPCTIETCSRVWFWFPFSSHGAYLVISTQAAKELAWITPLVVNVCKECILRMVECRGWLIFKPLNFSEHSHAMLKKKKKNLMMGNCAFYFFLHMSLNLLFCCMWCSNCCQSFTSNDSCKQRSKNVASRLFFFFCIAPFQVKYDKIIKFVEGTKTKYFCIGTLWKTQGFLHLQPTMSLFPLRCELLIVA